MRSPQFRYLANWMNAKRVTLVAGLQCECGGFGDVAIAAHGRALETPGGHGRAAKLGRSEQTH